MAAADVVAAGAEADVLVVDAGVLEVEEGDELEHAPIIATIVNTATPPAAIRTLRSLDMVLCRSFREEGRPHEPINIDLRPARLKQNVSRNLDVIKISLAARPARICRYVDRIIARREHWSTKQIGRPRGGVYSRRTRLRVAA